MGRSIRVGHRGGGDADVDNKKSAKKVSPQSPVSNATPLGVEESQRVEEAHDH